MAVLLRTAMTSEDAAEILRKHITTQVVDFVADTIDAPEARLRAALAGAILMGVASQRFILHMPELATADLDEILRLITPLLQKLMHPE